MPRSPSTALAAAQQQKPIDRSTGHDLAALGHKAMPVLTAIKAKCLDCSGGNKAEVRDCLVRNCALFPFRMGTNPWRPPASEARREAARRSAGRLKKDGTIPAFGATDGAAGPIPPGGGHDDGQ
jgi:hypothetical protein